LRNTGAKPQSWVITGNAGTGGKATVLVLQGMLLQGADLVLQGSFDAVYLRMMTLDPGTPGTPPDIYGTAIDLMELAPSTLFIEGSVTKLVLDRCITGPIRTRDGGAIEELTATDSVLQAIPTHTVVSGIPADPPVLLDPEALAASLKTGSNPLAISLVASSPALQADLAAYDLGSVPSAAFVADMAAAVATLKQVQAEAAWPLALADLALGFSEGTVSLSRCTVMGPIYTHRLQASECILDDVATVEDPQFGCVRFTAYATGSSLHQPYRSVQVTPRTALFETRAFGQPEYAKLRSDADSRIVTSAGGETSYCMDGGTDGQTILGGAQNGSEMGVYCLEGIALKRRGLALKFQEYAPLGQLPVWIDVD
jgi:hypothetical protein